MTDSDTPLDPFSHPPLPDDLFDERIKVGIALALQLHGEGLIEEAKMIFEQVRRDAQSSPGCAVLLQATSNSDRSELEGIAQAIENRLRSVARANALRFEVGENDN